MPNECKGLSMLSCINAYNVTLPNLYIFRGNRFKQNFSAKCGLSIIMVMQPKVWMIAILFDKWISHFIISIQNSGGNRSPTNPHLLILDGHNSHVTLDVVHKAMGVGLNLMTLSSHISHALQPLYVIGFKPFKIAFKTYRNVWTLPYKVRDGNKEDLAQWVSLTLMKTLTITNICKGFSSIRILPLNPNAIVGKM